MGESQQVDGGGKAPELSDPDAFGKLLDLGLHPLVLSPEGWGVGFRVCSAPAMHVVMSVGVVVARRRVKIVSSKYRGTETCTNEGVAACPVLCAVLHVAFPPLKPSTRAVLRFGPNKKATGRCPLLGQTRQDTVRPSETAADGRSNSQTTAVLREFAPTKQQLQVGRPISLAFGVGDKVCGNHYGHD